MQCVAMQIPKNNIFVPSKIAVLKIAAFYFFLAVINSTMCTVKAIWLGWGPFCSVPIVVPKVKLASGRLYHKHEKSNFANK